MRLLSVALLCAAITTTIVSCSDDNKDVERGSIRNVTVEWEQSYGCGTGDCYHSFGFGIDDEIGGKKYWAMIRNDFDTLLGNIQVPDTIDGRPVISFTVPYFTEMPYFENPIVEVYRCGSKCEPGVTDDAHTSGSFQLPINVVNMDASCRNTCCTDSLLHEGYYYAGVGGNTPSGTTELSGLIDTRYGKLCGENYDSKAGAHAVAHLSVSTASVDQWAQFGYGRFRNPGLSTVEAQYYYEVQGFTYQRYFGEQWVIPFPPPVEGTPHDYRLTFDPPNSRWTFYLDGVVVGFLEDVDWTNASGSQVVFEGEIYGRECDMPGTSANPCQLTGMSYINNGTTYTPSLSADSRICSDWDEWRINILSPGSAEIMDLDSL